MTSSKQRPSAWTIFLAILAVAFLLGSVALILTGQGDASYGTSLGGGALVFLAFYSYGTDRMARR